MKSKAAGLSEMCLVDPGKKLVAIRLRLDVGGQDKLGRLCWSVRNGVASWLREQCDLFPGKKLVAKPFNSYLQGFLFRVDRQGL